MRAISLLLLPMLAAAGCTTMKSSNTARTATEQLLISNSVDQSLAKVNFQPFAGRAVYLEEKYLEAVDKNYVLASVRHHILNAGGTVVPKPDNAEVVMEVRSGAIGTDQEDLFLGVPAIQLPAPIPVSLPEVRIVTRTSQKGTAKIGIVAYDAKTKRALGTGGMTLAQSDTNNWYFFGIGPYQNGSIRNELTVQESQPDLGHPVPRTVAFDSGNLQPVPGRERIRFTNTTDSGAGN